MQFNEDTYSVISVDTSMIVTMCRDKEWFLSQLNMLISFFLVMYLNIVLII